MRPGQTTISGMRLVPDLTMGAPGSRWNKGPRGRQGITHEEAVVRRARPDAVIRRDDQEGVLPLAGCLEPGHELAKLVVLVRHRFVVQVPLGGDERHPADAGLLKPLPPPPEDP